MSPGVGGDAFCAALAGVDGVSPRLAASALDQARVRFGAVVDELTAAFDAGGLDAVQASPHVGAARAITYFLYTGLLPDEEGQPVGGPWAAGEMGAEDYFESLMWRVVQAHPRGLSGGYYGHWHYPAEDDDGRR